MKVFSFIPPRLGGLDMLLPIFIKLKREKPSVYLEAIFTGPKCWEQLKREPFLFEQFNIVVDRITILPRNVDSIFSMQSLIHYMMLIGIVIRVSASQSPRILHTRLDGGRLIRWIYTIAKLRKGITYGHMNGLALLLERLPVSTSSVWDGDGFLCFGSRDEEYLRAKGHLNLYAIGYPRLYKDWLEIVRKEGGCYFNTEIRKIGLKNSGTIVTLFLGSTVPNIFELHELDDWLSSAVKAIRVTVPNAAIIVKPHPMQKKKDINYIFRKVEDKNIWVSYLHPSLLALNSKIVIAFHTSTIIDALALNIPTIQYQHFTENWLKAHPEGSSFLLLEPIWARSQSELESSINYALSETYEVPNIVEKLHHHENLAPLYNLEAVDTI
jgi:hypothetical protein